MLIGDQELKLRDPYIYISYDKEKSTLPYIRVDSILRRETNPWFFIVSHHYRVVMKVDKLDYTDNLIHGYLINVPFDKMGRLDELVLMSQTFTYIPNGSYFN